VICIFLLSVSYTEVVDDEGEHDVARYVAEKARGVGALDVSVCAEVPDEASLA
jgi:hypothetical protein